MAGKNVVREDVVQISFDIENNPFGELLDEVGSVKDFVEGMITGMTEEFNEFKKECTEAAREVSEITKEGAGMKSVAERLGSAKDAAGGFVAKLKDIGKQNTNSLISRLTQIKTTLTQGKTGASGFVTALKNVGKISVTGVANGVKSVVSRVKEATKEGGKLHTALKKVAGVSMNALHSGLSKVGSATKKAASHIGSGLMTAAKVGTGALVAGAAAVGAVVAKSVNSFADYEQLTGGVETLFKDSAGMVQGYAKEAYRTAGLSANEYMETVTGFSASLLQGLGGDTVKAANLADTAIRDMADNANKMGTDMESIQNAYQGFAKQNYTMLDNLKLGYGGTKTEMERLLKDAEKIKAAQGEVAHYSVDSYSDIIEAIHAVQAEMGITGTTALEAEHTISGSLASMKSAWSNVLVGLTTGGDMFDESLDALIVTVKNFIRNVIPAVKGAVSGIGYLIADIAPEIAKELPDLINSVLPDLISAAADILVGIANAIPSILQTALPALSKGVISFINTMLDVISDNSAQIFDAVTGVLMELVDAAADILPKLVTVGMDLIISLAKGIGKQAPTLIPAIIKGITEGLNAIISKLPDFIVAGMEMIMGLAKGFVKALPELIRQIPVMIRNLIKGITEHLPEIIQMGIELVIMLAVGLIQAIPELIAAIPEIISAIWDGITSIDWLELGKSILTGIANGIKNSCGGLIETVKGAFEKVRTGITNAMDEAKRNVTERLDAIKTAYEEHGGGIQGVVYGAMEVVKQRYKGAYDYLNRITNGKFGEIIQTGKQKLEEFAKGFRDKFEEIKTKVTSVFKNVKATISGAIEKVKGFFKFDWELPKLEMPHFSITPPNWKLSDLLTGSIPKLGIEWYAKGGIMEKPTVFGMNGNSVMAGGEAGAEAILPLKEFWKKLKDFTAPGRDIVERYTPERDAAVYNTSTSRTTTNNTYFNLTISGSEDDRKMERKIKRWIKEAIREEDESVLRRNPDLITI